MAILLTCSCGRKLKIKEEFAGQEGQCPACGATLMIPFPDQVPEVALAEPAPVAAVPESEPEQRSDQEVRRVPARRDQTTEKISNHGGGDLPGNAANSGKGPPEIGPLGATTTRRANGRC